MNETAFNELAGWVTEAGLIGRPEDGRAAYDRFRGRVMFPITDRRGRVIAPLCEGYP